VRKAAAADVALAQGEAHSTAHRYLAAAAEFAKAVALFEDMHGVHARTHARTPWLAPPLAPCMTTHCGDLVRWAALSLPESSTSSRRRHVGALHIDMQNAMQRPMHRAEVGAGALRAWALPLHGGALGAGETSGRAQLTETLARSADQSAPGRAAVVRRRWPSSTPPSSWAGPAPPMREAAITSAGASPCTTSAWRAGRPRSRRRSPSSAVRRALSHRGPPSPRACPRGHHHPRRRPP
jgi:hypothetical protein